MEFPHGVMATLRSVTTTTDDHGDSTEVVVERDWGPVAIAPRSSEERTDPRSPAVLSGYTIYGPTESIDADDSIVVDGVTYQVEGDVGEWRNPFTGWEPGIEVAVRRVG